MVKSLFSIGLFVLSGLLFGQEGEIKKFYYPNGTLSSEGRMVNGKPDGEWISYYPNGIIKSVGIRKNHLLDSIWKFYNENGDLVQSINYNLGKKNGYVIDYYIEPKQPINKGKIKAKELFVNDKKNGMSLYFYEDGSLKEEVYYLYNEKNGLSYEYNSEGLVQTIKRYKNDVLIERDKINRMVDDLKDGVWMEFYDDGKMKHSVEYNKGIRDGYSKFYDRKGDIIEVVLYRNNQVVESNEGDTLDIVEKRYNDNGKVIVGSFNNNTKVGIHRAYLEDSLVISFIYSKNGVLLEEGKLNREGIRSGKWLIYYDNGDVYAKGNYIRNKKSGKWEYFYQNGNLLQKGYYKKGKPDGEWTWYYRNGDTLRYEEFIAGKENGYYLEYDQENNIIAEGYYIDGEKDGDWFYNAGDITERGSYVFGLKNGEWTQHYENGKLRYVGTYIQGNADGKHKFYYPDGTIKEEQFYISGYKEGNWKKYDRTGDVFLVITYENNMEVRINGKKIDLTDNKILIR
ncbi:MAG: hypothetical protein GVY19_13775 [Bacteroidetes bacterium]|jgi:antitoxin component YwqK of YwqJK toxin-antitoxin module|nr:hypothetical protein [Bacteroidota bacterium]